MSNAVVGNISQNLKLFHTEHNETRHTTWYTLRLSTYQASKTTASTCRLYIQPPHRRTSL